MAKAFTIIELSVTVGLLVLILTLSVISYRQVNKRTELILTAQQAASALRLAESYAASAREWQNNAGSNIWGLYFNKAESHNRELIMFVDVNGDGQYGGDQEKYKVIALPAQTKIGGLYHKIAGHDSQAVDGDEVSVTFVPPDPKTRFCEHGSGHCGSNWLDDSSGRSSFDSEDWSDMYIVLFDESNQSVRRINVNFFGLIDAYATL